ncbi:MAG: hypothetical protein CMI35_16860 [Owenweeksia sp.]|nr:hypothetical protein [Owenweeksia sp.]
MRGEICRLISLIGSSQAEKSKVRLKKRAKDLIRFILIKALMEYKYILKIQTEAQNCFYRLANVWEIKLLTVKTYRPVCFAALPLRRTKSS